MDRDAVTVATADETLREAALRWSAAAGVATDVVDEPAALRSRWRTAPLVLLGDDLAQHVVDAGLSRRDHLLLVSRSPDVWWRTAVDLGAEAVLEVGDDPAAVRALGRALDGGTEGCSIAVVGGSGGVGATTFAAALGLEAVRRDLTAVVLDADPFGGGVELVVGSEHQAGLRWPDLASAEGRVASTSLAEALPHHHGLATVSWPTSAEIVEVPATADAVRAATTRAFDLVVADLPRAAHDPWCVGVAAGSVLTVVVVADDVGGLASARRVVAPLAESGATVASVVAARRGGLGADAVEQTLGVPVVARVRPDRRLRVAVDHGAGPRSRSLSRASRQVLDLVGLAS